VQLGDLLARIDCTNLAATLPDSRSLTDALAQRDMLKLRVGILNGSI
jgi:uncharacterized protein DUF6847